MNNFNYENSIYYQNEKKINAEALEIIAKAEKIFQEINQMISRQTVNVDSEIIFTNYSLNKNQITISCTCVFKNKNIALNTGFQNLIAALENIAEMSREKGIIFNYTITSLKDFETIYEEALAKIAPSTLLHCKDVKHFRYFNCMNPTYQRRRKYPRTIIKKTENE